MDCSPPGFSVHGILQARILEWGAIPFSRGSSRPQDWTCISCIGRGILYGWATSEAPDIVNTILLIHLCIINCITFMILPGYLFIWTLRARIMTDWFISLFFFFLNPTQCLVHSRHSIDVSVQTNDWSQEIWVEPCCGPLTVQETMATHLGCLGPGVSR